MSYTKVGWENEPSRSTPINAQNLDKMDSAIKDHDERLESLESDSTALDERVDTAESNITTLQGNVSNIGTTLASTNSRVSTAENNISSLSSAMGTANSNITNLQGRMTTAEGDIDTLEGSVFSERKVYTERFATNVTGNGRLMLMVSTWKKDTACVNVRFSNRVTGGFTDVVLMIKQNSYYTKCKLLYNNGIPISKIYRGSNNTTFDFEIPSSNAYDVYVTAPVWVSGTYGAQSTLDGTEMTIDSFNYDEMELTVGNLNSLSTTTHSNIVAAINEVNGKIVESDYVITEYSVPYVSGSNTIFMVRSNDVSVVGDEEYLLNVEVIKSNGSAVEMLFRTTDDSVVNDDVFIFNKPQTSSYEAIPISKVEDASSFISGNNAALWVTLEGTPDVTVRLIHHKSKTYTVVSSPAMPSGTGRELTLYIGNYAIWSKSNYNGQTGENVVKTNSGVSLITDGIDGDIGILNTGEGDSQFANVRVFTPEGDIRLNNNYVGKTNVSGIGDGTITGAIAFSNNDGEEVSGNPITVLDAIDANAVGLSVDIGPVQDLHGYDNPWVGGAGKNKFQVTLASRTKDGVTYDVQSNGIVNVSGTPTSYADVVLGTALVTSSMGTVTISGLSHAENIMIDHIYLRNSSDTILRNIENTTDKTFVINLADYPTVAKIDITVKRRTNGTACSGYLDFQIESGSTVTSFEPYSNICPISAVTESRNLFPYSQLASSSASGLDINIPVGTYKLSFKRSRDTSPSLGISIRFYYDNGESIVVSGASSFTAERTIISLNYSLTNYATGDYLYDIQVEKGDTATDYEPYHEPQIEIQRVGKNLFGGLDFAQKLYDSSNTHDLNTTDKTIQYNRRGGDGPMVLYDRFEENTAYTLILTGKVNSANTTNNSITFRDSTNSYMSTITFDSTTKTRKKVTVGGNGASVKDLVLAWANAGLTTLYYEECGLFEGDVSIEEFEEYLGTKYIIKTGSNVYGGTLDATTGKLVVDRAIKEFNGGSSESWSYSLVSNSYYQASLQFNLMKDSMGIISNEFETISISDRGTKNGIVEFTDKQIRVALLGDFGITSAEQWKTWLASNPLQVCYELATSQTINLTPTQVKMLKGTNTVSSNAQNINLTYLKDNAVGKAVSIVEKEIEPQIEEIHNELNTKLNADSIAPVENGTTASTSYAVGSYIVRNNNLYKVISAIASGASFTNNNIQQTTVMAEILARL